MTVSVKPPLLLPEGMAVLVSGTVMVVSGLALVTVRAPFAVPMAVGVAVMLTVQLDAALRVVPQVVVVVKPVVTASASPVVDELPVLLTVSDRVLLLPSGMLPNARDVGATVSWGCVPVPVRVAVRGKAVAAVLTETDPA